MDNNIPFVNDPELYARMCQGRPVEEAQAAYEEFWKVVVEARERFKIRDVVLVSTLAIKEGEGAEVTAMVMGYRGDPGIVPELLARALGGARKNEQKRLDELAGTNRQKRKR